MNAQNNNPAGGKLKGFGGWLILPMIGQTLSPIYSLSTLGNNLKIRDQFAALPNGMVAYYGENILTLAMLTLQVVTIFALYSKSHLFPRLFLIQWLALIAYIVLDTGLVSAVLNIPPGALFKDGEMGRTLGPIVAGGIWSLYMFKSERVRNTFVRGSLSHGVARHLEANSER
ncbi:DUF2569 domain-containing protein [Rhizobium leguminosarum]|uniref:DUF2569 family protein n=1 Tax=Rhizobium leguminosarum TaxID=384 RepID=A0A7K3VRP4_RHILE|nr:DUF2569 domain-containing protein [Rhizobium leguminosarum]NEK19866.1 DUF2569 family protein [Rhizobium leguminosarum]